MSIKKLVLRMLKKNRYWFYRDREGQRFYLTQQMKNLLVGVTLLIDEDNLTLYVFGQEPEMVPTEFRSEVNLYLTRFNKDLKQGSLSLDPNDGTVRFLLVFDALSGRMSVGAVKQALHLASMVIDLCHPGLMRILHGQETAEKAYQSIMPSENDETGSSSRFVVIKSKTKNLEGGLS